MCVCERKPFSGRRQIDSSHTYSQQPEIHRHRYKDSANLVAVYGHIFQTNLLIIKIFTYLHYSNEGWSQGRIQDFGHGGGDKGSLKQEQNRNKPFKNMNKRRGFCLVQKFKCKFCLYFLKVCSYFVPILMVFYLFAKHICSNAEVQM